MAIFEQYSPKLRKKIAVAITVGVGVVLVALMVLMYSKKEPKGSTEPTSRFRTFYTTILERGQSYLGTK